MGFDDYKRDRLSAEIQKNDKEMMEKARLAKEEKAKEEVAKEDKKDDE